MSSRSAGDSALPDRDADTRPDEAVDSEEIAELVADYIDRHQLGEELDPEQILAEHGALGPQVVEALHTFFDLDTSGGPESFVQKLGGLRLSRVIGRGGMAIVYEGWEDALDRRVAVKVLPAGAVADGRSLRRFLREARTAARLRHSNVVTVHGVGLASGVPYFSMEYVSGETLAALWTRLGMLRGGPSSPGELRAALREALTRLEAAGDEAPPGPSSTITALEARYARACARVFAGAARGLQHAHEEGVVHRDLKPSNLILDEAGELRILDFGLARLEGEASLTVTGGLVGTPLYMSPEQARSGWTSDTDEEPDRRTDIYSLGVTLYQALARRHPFDGLPPRQVLRETLESEPPPLPSRVPAPLQAIVARCLRKEPEKRYATAEALAQDLDRFVRGEPVEARPESRLRRRVRLLWSRRYRIAAGVLAAALVFVSSWALRQGLGSREGMLETTMWEEPSMKGSLAVSADASKVAFIDWADYGSIGVRDLESGQVVDATAFAGTRTWDQYASHVLISPDGGSVLFTWEDVSDPSRVRGELIRVDLDEPTVRHALRIDVPGYHAALDWAAEADLVLTTAQDGGEPLWLLVSPHDGRIVLQIEAQKRTTTRLSPDGRFVACESKASELEPTRDIRLLDLWTGAYHELLVGPDDDRLVDFSPDGRHLAFSSDRLGSKGLWLLPISEGRAAGPPERVQRGFENESAGIAADGRLFSVESWRNQRVWVSELTSEGGIATARPAVRKALGSSAGGSWSPSGSRLAFRASEGGFEWHSPGDWTIRLLDARTSEERVLAIDPPPVPESPMRGPIWLDEATLVVYARLRELGDGLWTVGVGDGHARRLAAWEQAGTPLALQHAGGAVWYTTSGSNRHRLMRCDPSAGEEREIEGWPNHAWQPAISPDGQCAAYVDERRLSGDAFGLLVVVDLELDRVGASRVVPWLWLETQNVDVFLRWTPDGRWIVAHEGGASGEAHLLNVETGEERIWPGFPPHVHHAIEVDPTGTRVAFSTNAPGFRLVSLSGWLPD